ncbi:MAG: hypothetical protein JOS17DRAFT_766694 [Linnemannia elongata]|nr:MAG: hypothetical protein JOS17DRAFT_766694 [Linnemannia elongata]
MRFNPFFCTSIILVVKYVKAVDLSLSPSLSLSRLSCARGSSSQIACTISPVISHTLPSLALPRSRSQRGK